jgi:outer membrane receptor for ferrienterochelin and colicin
MSILSLVSVAQGEVYHFDCKSGENLESALERFGNKYDVRLSYPAYILNQIYPGEVKLSSDNLEDLLAETLSPSDIEYQLLAGKKVLLRKVSHYKMEFIDEDEVIDVSGIIKGNDGSFLEFATVSIPSLQVGTYTDDEGRYRLLIDGGSIDESVIISYIGYESSNLKIRDLIDQKRITLSPSNEKIEEVTVSGQKPIVIINQLSATTELRISNILSVGSSTIQSNDILRKLQFLPGISATDDKSSSISIRGADDSETLVLVDGIPIYKTDHFYGIFGNVNGSYVNDVTLYKNELPINQSGKSGGLVSMTSPQSVKNLKGTASIDLLNSSLSLGIPIDENWNVFLAGRASYNNVANAGFFEKDENISTIDQTDFNRPTVLGVTPSFDFYDLNGKLSYQTKNLAFSANVFKSYDALSSAFENSFTARGPRGSNRRITVQESFENDESWENNGASFNIYAKLPNQWSLSSTSYFTQYMDNNELNFSITDDRRQNPTNKQIQNGNENRITDWSSTLMATKVLQGTSISFGGKFVIHQNELTLGQNGRSIFNNDQDGVEKGVFASINHPFSSKVTLNAGIRATHYDQTDQFYYSPQLALSFIPLQNISFKASVSRNYQYVRELTYSNRFGEEVEVFVLSNGRRLTIGSSNNYMVGGIIKMDKWLFDVEFYHIDRDNVLNYTAFLPQLVNNDQSNDPRFELLNGRGRTRGMDLMASYQSKEYSGILSYTLSKSENSFKEIFRNNAFPSQDDRRHQLTFTNTYKYQDWDFSANAVYSSGRNYTDLSILSIGEDRRNNNPRDFQNRLPHYMRFDLSADYGFVLGKNKAKVGVSVLNLLDRANVKYLQFTASVQVEQGQGGNTTRQIILGTETLQLGRTLNFNFNLEF